MHFPIAGASFTSISYPGIFSLFAKCLTYFFGLVEGFHSSSPVYAGKVLIYGRNAISHQLQLFGFSDHALVNRNGTHLYILMKGKEYMNYKEVKEIELTPSCMFNGPISLQYLGF